MSGHEALYHNPMEPGYWTDKDVFHRDITLRDGYVLVDVVPVGVEVRGDHLVMVMSTFEGEIAEPIGNFFGLKVVFGDSQNHPHETNGEQLIEFTYFKKGQMEETPRRIRPTGVMFGIMGDTEEESAEKGGHRAMRESADFYLEGHDTQYEPGESGNDGLRFFPFWRSGVWGDPRELVKEYLPEPQEK